MKCSIFFCSVLTGLVLLTVYINFLVAAEPNNVPDHSLLTQVLAEYVNGDAVDYKAIQGDERFSKYIDILQKTDPAKISEQHLLAFWINAYNAFTIQYVINNYPIKSLMNELAYAVGTGAFKSRFIEINRKKYSLNDIENDIIRPMGDPRIHFALVCGAKSCPPLRLEAYEGERLGEQMDEQGRLFLSQTNKNRFDFEKHEVHLSKIFDWFKDDFRKDGKTELDFISRYLPQEQAQKLLAGATRLKVKHTEYDWDLNE